MSAPFSGQYAELTGWRYSDGDGHFAFDYACPLHTPLFAVADGVVLDCADGSPNDDPGDPNYSGEPSNWITLGIRWDKRDVTVYYQHLSPGLKVKRGQKVKEGQLIAHSGNSGNSSGPHLHIATMYGKRTSVDRYAYMLNDGDNDVVIYPPDKIWKDDDMPLNAEDKQWIRDTVEKIVHNEVWEKKIERLEGVAAQTFEKTIERWERTRGTVVVAQASAEATVRALQKAGVASGAIDPEAIAQAVANELATRIKE